jgi:hypothetical protein
MISGKNQAIFMFKALQIFQTFYFPSAKKPKNKTRKRPETSLEN